MASISGRQPGSTVGRSISGACRHKSKVDAKIGHQASVGAARGALALRLAEPEAQAAATLEGAWDAGIRYYDTAPWAATDMVDLTPPRHITTLYQAPSGVHQIR